MKIRGGLNKTQSAILYALACLAFAIYANLPTSWSTTNSDSEYESITIMRPAIAGTFFILTALTALALFAAALSSLWRPTLRYPGVAALLAVFGFPITCGYHFVHNLGPWTEYGHVTASDGETYAFCDSSFLMGQVMAITRIAEENAFVKHFDVLVTNNGDSPRSWASVIRPANPVEQYGQLYLSQDDVLVGIRFENHCYLAYDLRTRRGYGHGDVETLSPFICLDTNSGLNAPDLATTITTMREVVGFVIQTDDDRHAAGFLKGESYAGYPHEATLREGLTHGNPQVQDAARQLLAVHEDAMQKVRARASKGSDAK